MPYPSSWGQRPALALIPASCDCVPREAALMPLMWVSRSAFLAPSLGSVVVTSIWELLQAGRSSVSVFLCLLNKLVVNNSN